MNNLTLIIPAKQEKESLSKVLDELEPYNLKIVIILEKEDLETIEIIDNKKFEILYQKGRGYGDALIQGINHVETELFCIFNADGSFNPIEIGNMIKMIKDNNSDLLFASRYEKDCSSDDDTFVTLGYKVAGIGIGYGSYDSDEDTSTAISVKTNVAGMTVGFRYDDLDATTDNSMNTYSIGKDFGGMSMTLMYEDQDAADNSEWNLQYAMGF